MSDVEYAECSVCGIGSEVTRLWFDSEDDTVPPYYLSLCHQCKPRLTRPNDAKWISVNDELIEKCAEAVHKAYCDYHIKNKGEEYWTRGDYSLLDEATKQIDRETVKAVLEICKQSSEEREKL